MINQPLAEVFGFPINNTEQEALRARKLRFCPYNNRVPNCTRDRAENPLGVCSINTEGNVAITCPIRFRENWLLIEEAANCFFEPNTMWTSVTNVNLFDRRKNLMGTLDFVLVAYDQRGKILDFAAIETQAAFVTKNLRRPFEAFMENPDKYCLKDFSTGQFPQADFQTSIRQRLAAELIYKGSIFYQWKKKFAIALDKLMFENLPPLPLVDKKDAELTWIIYELVYNDIKKKQVLTHYKTAFSLYAPSLFQIMQAEAGPIDDFISELQECLDIKFENGYGPDAASLMDIIVEE